MSKLEKSVVTIEHIQCDIMVRLLRIEVRLPEGHWSGDVSRAKPEAVLRIEETMPLGRGRGKAQIYSSEDIEAQLNQHPGVESIISLNKNRYSVDIAPGGGGHLKAIRKSGVVPQSPFEVRDGWVGWTIECSNEQSRELVSNLREDNIPFRVLSTRTSEVRLLTPRQREVFEAALREGYWEEPRRITLSSLANLLGVAKSTLSVQLHAIESNVIGEFADEIRKRSP